MKLSTRQLIQQIQKYYSREVVQRQGSTIVNSYKFVDYCVEDIFVFNKELLILHPPIITKSYK